MEFGPIKLAASKFQTRQQDPENEPNAIPMVPMNHVSIAAVETHSDTHFLAGINSWIEELLVLGGSNPLPNAIEICEYDSEDSSPGNVEVCVDGAQRIEAQYDSPQEEREPSSTKSNWSRRSFSDTGLARYLRRSNADDELFEEQKAIWESGRTSSDLLESEEAPTNVIYVEVEGIYDGQCDLYFDPFTMQQLNYQREQERMLNAVRLTFSRILGMRDIVENDSTRPVQLVGGDWNH
jgi:hypothetical protein